MVIFVNLEENTESSKQPQHWLNLKSNSTGETSGRSPGSREGVLMMAQFNNEEKGFNVKNAVVMALACYPIVKEIVSHFDLNSLDALSSTCRQVRANLLQFRTLLIRSTLHCVNERRRCDQERASNCARDFVNPCQRCGKVNCVMKPPAPSLLRFRHRRICRTCSSQDLSTLLFPSTKDPRSHDQCTSTFNQDYYSEPDQISLKLHICKCASDPTWFCKACDRSIRSADQEYETIWKWSTRFLLSLGGLGIGIGEGNRGLQCGRGENCAQASEVELEIDGDAEDARESDYNNKQVNIKPRNTLPNNCDIDGRSHMRPGYNRHEIEGIGGVLKKKLVKMVKVGACVPSSDCGGSACSYGIDALERNELDSLTQEIAGKSRSWCSWCQKIIPSYHDYEMTFPEPPPI